MSRSLINEIMIMKLWKFQLQLSYRSQIIRCPQLTSFIRVPESNADANTD